MGELGFLGIHFPEEYGGQGGDYFMSIVRGEAMAHANNGGLVMGVAVHTDMATPPILKFGSEHLKQTYLVPAIKGEKISSLGISEPGAGSDVAGIRTRAVRDGDEYVINGSKTFITNGVRADFIVLVTKTDPDAGYDGFSLFVVPTRLARLPRLEEAREARDALLGHRGADVRGRARAGREPASARRARASTTSCGSSRASA